MNRRLAICALAFAAFTAPALSSSLAAQNVPTPESVLGFAVGDDFRLASYEDALAYFQALDAASDRLELRQIGATSEGRPWYIALISSPENLRNVDRYREISLRLAHPEGLSDAEARALAQDGKTIVAIEGGLHATETAHAQHTIQLAYDLVTEKDGATTRAILDNVITLLWTSINPDGQTMVADWYESNLGTPFELSPLPGLYQAYIGHDNNRDGYGLNMIETRVVQRLVRSWEPQVMYSHHQTSPFPATIWLPPYADPVHGGMHPLITRMMSFMGMAAANALEARGQLGATHMGVGYDAWYPGYNDFVSTFHNVVIMFSETGLHGSATPRFYRVQDFPPQDRDLRPGSLHVSRWPGGWWRLKTSVDYMLTTSMSTLDVAAKYRENLLFNRYQAGRDVIQTYAEGPPYAYLVPQEQRDPVAAVELLRRLAFHSTDVQQLTAPVTLEGRDYPAGTWIIPMDRANASLAQALLAPQDYPELRASPEAPVDQPYDVAGWTLPYQMDVRVIAVGSPLGDDVRAAMEPVSGDVVPWDAPGDAAPFDMVPGAGFDTNATAAGIVPPAGRLTGGGRALEISAVQNNGFRALNRAWDLGAQVRLVGGVPGTDGGPGTAARYLITGLDGSAANQMVADYALQARRSDAGGVELPRPRIGLYRPWTASIDEGWTRWLFEQFGFAFQSLYNADVRAGDLRDRYDVIVLPEMRGRQIVQGRAVGTVPARYSGGIGDVGVRAIDEFVRAGGTLVALNGSSDFAIEQLHLPVENVVGELSRRDFYQPGSISELTVDTSHPVMAGMAERANFMMERGPVFTVTDDFKGSVLAKYQAVGSPLRSGYLLGEEHIQGYAGALDVEHGAGHVVLLGFRPQWRAQSYGTFKVLFNSALYSSAVAATVQKNEAFWQRPEKKDDGEEGEESQGNGQGRRGGVR